MREQFRQIAITISSRAKANNKRLCRVGLYIAVSLLWGGYIVAGFAQDRNKSEGPFSNETLHCVMAKTWDERTQKWVWMSRGGNRLLGVEKKEEQANRDCEKYLKDVEKANGAKRRSS